MGLVPPGLIRGGLFHGHVPFFIITTIALVNTSFFTVLHNGVVDRSTTSHHRVTRSGHGDFGTVRGGVGTTGARHSTMMTRLSRCHSLVTGHHCVTG